MRKVAKYDPYYEDDEIIYDYKEKETMTEEKLDLIKKNANFMLEDYPHWRKGQAIFNSAFDLFPHETSFLRGSTHDCFHNDDLIDEFLANL